MGKKLGVEKVHPHKFRRTMATRAIEKGMPIEQVQKILGHMNQIIIEKDKAASVKYNHRTNLEQFIVDMRNKELDN